MEENNPTDSKNKRRLSETLLVLTTILWGTTFIITETLVNVIPPLFYLGIRFLIGALVFLPYIKRFKLNKNIVKVSFIAGLLYFISILTQTYGLKDPETTASEGAFITALSVIMVPIILSIFSRKKLPIRLWIGVVSAVLGTAIMTLIGSEVISTGDILVFICAVFYAIYIIYIGNKTQDFDTIVFSAMQLLFISIFSFSISAFTEFFIIFENIHAIFSLSNILVLIYMGAVATSLPSIFQIYGQRHVSSQRAAIIFALEPVFATFFAVIIGGNTFNWQTIIGGVLILAGIIVSIEKRDN
jgi:drug/metabolite transporter (DMT)-like permease